MPTQLRADITGLRAIAVLAVTLFHITHVFKTDTQLFVGGFLGVDIFFVISGYLMTMIIYNGLESGKFSLWDFYKRRAKRICPALLAVILSTLVIAFLITNLNFFRSTVLREALVSLGFISNFRFAREVDYFDGGDYTHLFLHTWSLSVEWQFYIFYPLILLTFNKFISLKQIPRFLIALTVLSFITSVVWTEFSPRQSYYLLPSRACELLFGSLAYFYPLSKIVDIFKLQDTLFGNRSNALYGEMLGLFLIALSLFVVNDNSGWPTAWLLLPMLGAWLCIASNNQKSVLRNIFFQKIGLWSYSIYLVHWPVIVFISLIGLTDWHFIWIAPIFALGITLHYLVERKRNYGWSFCIIYFIAAGCIYFADANKLAYKINPRSLDFFTMDGNEGFRGGETLLLGDSTPEFILHGDSHSLDYVKPFYERKHSFILNSMRACYSLGNHVDPYIQIGNLDKPLRDECRLLYKKTKALADLYHSIPVIISQNWPIYGQQHLDSLGYKNKEFIDPKTGDYTFNDDEYFAIIYDDLLQIAKDLYGRNVYIIGRRQGNPLNGTGSFTKQKYLNTNLSKQLVYILNIPRYTDYSGFDVNEALKDAVAKISVLRSNGHKLARLIYVNPDIYCSSGRCELFVDGNTQIYSDTNHYSWAGAEKPVSQLLLLMGKDKGNERTTFDTVPDVDFDRYRTTLRYSEGSGFDITNR